MGDIREFWLAVLFYGFGTISLFFILNSSFVPRLPPLLVAILVILGGFMIGAGAIIAWSCICNMYYRRKK